MSLSLMSCHKNRLSLRSRVQISKQSLNMNKNSKIKYEVLTPKANFKPFDKDNAEEEQELTELLFGNSNTFINSLHEQESDTSEIVPESSKRKPAWEDEEDEVITVGKALKVQHRKLPRGGLNDSKIPYTKHLTSKYKNLVGTPKWASLDEPKDNEANSDDDLFQTCGFIHQNTSVSKLPPNLVEYKKVKDLNAETYTEGKYINSVQFHPKSSVALVAGMSGIASFVAVDGKTNSKLQSVKFENFPIMCAQFTADANEAIFGSRMPFCFNYDLLTSQSTKTPLPHGMTQCKNFCLSPCGSFMAVAGKWGQVHLLSVHSKESIATL